MERAKEIIATFLKVNPAEINKNTLIDNSAIQGSVLIRRMYSILSSEGYHVADQSNIKTYGDFLKALNSNTITKPPVLNDKKESIIDQKVEYNDSSLQVGIDIEDIINMPITTDYREHIFYTDNFSQKEISYCILQANPRASFAGKFALKEAIVKADNSYLKAPFKDIEILNNKNGKPVFKGFSLSVSHTKNQAIAIAIKGSVVIETKNVIQDQISKNDTKQTIQSTKTTMEYIKPNNKLNYLSIILSLTAVSIVIFQSIRGG